MRTRASLLAILFLGTILGSACNKAPSSSSSGSSEKEKEKEKEKKKSDDEGDKKKSKSDDDDKKKKSDDDTTAKPADSTTTTTAEGGVQTNATDPDDTTDKTPPPAAAAANACTATMPASPGAGVAYGLVGCPCDAKAARIGCTSDKKQALRCVGGLWAGTESCGGANGCFLTSGSSHCDHAIGDVCQHSSRNAEWCGGDGRSIETCGRDGKVSVKERCGASRCGRATGGSGVACATAGQGSGVAPHPSTSTSTRENRDEKRH